MTAAVNLPEAFIDRSAHSCGQVQTPRLRRHRQRDAMILAIILSNPFVHIVRHAGGFLAELQIIARQETRFPMEAVSFGGV